MTGNAAKYNRDAKGRFPAPEWNAGVRTFLRLLRVGDITGRVVDVRSEEIWGGSRTTLSIVGTLLRYGGMSQKDIARAIARTQQSTTTALDDLERRGFIERGSNSKDRRVNSIELTQKGADHFIKVTPVLNEICDDVMSCLSEAEQEQLYQILTKLTSRLQQRAEKT